MVYMNPETFELLHNPSDTECLSDCVYVDDLIAAAIQILNQKGYFTDACCSGHINDNRKKKQCSYILFRKGILLPSLPEGYIEKQVKDIVYDVYSEKNGAGHYLLYSAGR